MLKTSQPRTTRTLASQCSQLINSKNFHKTEALHYQQLFNESVPAIDLDSPVIILHPITPLQEFWQQMSEHHIAEMVKVDAEISALCAA